VFLVVEMRFDIPMQDFTKLVPDKNTAKFKRRFSNKMIVFFFLPVPPHVLVDFVVLPPGHGIV